MNKVMKRVFILTLCMVFAFTGSVFAAETESTQTGESGEFVLAEEPVETEDYTEETTPADPAAEEQESADSDDTDPVAEEAVPDEDDSGSEGSAPDEESASAEDPAQSDPEQNDPAEEDPAEDPQTEDPDEEQPLSDPEQEAAPEEETPSEDEELILEPEEPAAEEETTPAEDKKDEEKEDPSKDEEIEKTDKEKEETEKVKAADAISAQINILSCDEYTGRFRFSVTGLSSVKNLSKVNLLIWHAADKSDLKSYKMVRQTDGSYIANMYKYLHQDHTGTYQVQAKVTFTDGSTKVVAKTTVTVKDHAPSLKIGQENGSYVFTAKYFPKVSKMSCAKFAIWSDKNGQDDIQWYQASINTHNTVSMLTTDLSKHADYGKYNVHVYAFYTDGSCELISAKTFTRVDLSKAGCTSFGISVNKTAGTFAMTLTGVHSPKAISSVKIAVWCKSESADKVWYTAKDCGSGKYTVTGNIKKHSYHMGTYHARAYVVGKDGKKTWLKTKTFVVDCSFSGLSVTTSDQQTYKAVLKKVFVPGGIQKMQFAVWSDTGGQDDLVWYNATGSNGGNYTASIKIGSHKHLGIYNIHIYATDAAGNMICLTTDTFKVIPAVKYTLTKSGTKDANGKFNVTIQVTSSSTPIKAMKYEVWCKTNKSDVHWYKVTGDADGCYKATINTANHYGNCGTYHINAVVVFKNGLEAPLTSTTQYFKPTAYLKVPVSQGNFKRRIRYVNPSVSSVSFKVWSVRGGMADSRIYQAKKDSNGVFYADVKMDHFTYDGKYNIRVYNGTKILDSGSFIMLDYLEEAYRFCYDDSIGYSQINRCLNPDVDCSSFVHYSLKNTGYNVGNGWPMTTYNEESVLRSVGFGMVAYTSISDLQAGDILLRDGHTEIYAGHGTTVGAHGDENDDIYGTRGGDQTGKEVCVAQLKENWQYFFRLVTYQT